MRPERDTDRDHAGALRHRVRDDPVEADGREQHFDTAEGAHRERPRFRGEERRPHLHLHRLVLKEDEVRLEGEELPPERSEERPGVAARAATS
jgi:hypothetical protein